MDNKTKGRAAELAVALALQKRGYTILFPFGDAEYDLAFDDGQTIQRVQVKHGRVEKGALAFKTHRPGDKSHYTGVDFFGVYASALDKVFLIPATEVTTKTVYLRLTPSTNNQKSGTREAEQFAL